MTDAATDAVVVPISATPADGVFRLKDIQVGKTDSRGLKITQLYATQTGDYAIYQAGGPRLGVDRARRHLVQLVVHPQPPSPQKVLPGFAPRPVFCPPRLALASPRAAQF